MEDLMYYVWQQRMFNSLTTVDHADIEILHPGQRNHDAGPDFFNAKIKIGTTVWAGNVEMHVKTSDWYRHHHHADKAYNNVILHVVLQHDAEIRQPDGEKMLTAVMTIPPQVLEEYHTLTIPQDTWSPIACRSRLHELPSIILHDWMTALVSQRMLGKVQRVRDLIVDRHDSWQSAFYVILARAFGTGINSDTCERLARSLPYEYLLKHIDHPDQIEAMLLGQAGWLEEERPAVEAYAYYRRLQQEYRFLRQKFSLSPLPASTWKMSKLRPQASPQLRVACLAFLLCRHPNLFSELLDAPDIPAITALFHIELRGFWETHYYLSPDASQPCCKRLGAGTIRSLIINAVVPILMAYGEWQGDSERCEQAIRLLESIPAESNRYTDHWALAGIPMQSAYDSQALLHLTREFCEPHKCMRCRIGCWLVRNRQS